MTAYQTDNSTNKITISYDGGKSGPDSTLISFHPEEPHLKVLFNPGSEQGTRRCFITDATVATLPVMEDFVSCFEDGACGQDILIILGSGEAFKTIESVLTVARTALDAGFNRTDTFVGIGGGVITDITGFAASIFKRGVNVEFVPTTLLAMVDASIGGKTGCDFDSYKNMIGTFYPAQKIHVFPKFVNTLSDEQYRSGLAESLKTAMLYDRELYDIFKNDEEKIKNRNFTTVSEIIQRCAAAKASVVEKDLNEKNERAFLNLGHTFGHALETVAGLGSISHGDAVAWGIGRAAVLSAKKEFCSESYKNEVLEMLERYGWDTAGIPETVTGGGRAERLLSAMKKDKKNLSKNIRLIFQKGLCETFLAEAGDEEILGALK